jgi:hypothetical protein
MAFPPVPVYPTGIDSDRTLFKVYNTSETRLSADNSAWAQELEIEPVGADEPEIWADNGFATISGELFYYDSVAKDENGKVYKMKRAARNLGGKRTQFNPAGTWVRGFVVAEHHNQIVQAVLNLENFIGVDNSTDTESLDYRIRNLAAEPSCFDDHECPDVIFEFEIIEASPDGCTGTTASYDLTINGSFRNFKIDFGDGSSTTSAQSGTHLYPPSANIDPIVTVTNDKCQIIQTAIEREAPDEPQPSEEEEVFTIDVPTIEFPQIVIPDCVIPDVTLTLPQITFPCELGIGSFGGVPSIIVVSPPIPSLIEFGEINIPTEISIVGGFTVPSLIEFGEIDIPNPITFGPHGIPSVIVFDACTEIEVVDTIPTTITVSGSLPSIISITAASIPSYISVVHSLPSVISLTYGTPPSVTVDWGSPPTVSCTVSIDCGGGGGALAARSSSGFDEDFMDSLGRVEVEAADVGIPSEIKIIAPKLPDLKLTHNLPSSILVESNIPETITLVGTIPSEIRIYADTEIPKQIELVSQLPSSILLDASSLPGAIQLQVPDKFPDISIVGNIPTTIQVIGIPDAIEIIGSIPSEIIIKPPENLEIPLVYKGAPIPVQFDLRTPSGDTGDAPCFALTPCGK